MHDSRGIAPGDLFVALPGQSADGHTFLEDAFDRGACGALVSDPSAGPEDAPNLIVVDDPGSALLRLATARRKALAATLVGITGSNGKTTTRALLAQALRETDDDPAIFSAPKNYNTEIGLPLALLAMPETASIGLFELGAECPGDIELLVDTLVPHIGLITTIGPSHLDGFGSIDAVAEEKWRLVEGLPPDGLAVVNADCPRLRDRATRAAVECLTVGLNHGEVRARLEAVAPRLILTIDDDPSLYLDVPLAGLHNATNLLLAAVTARRLGTPPEQIEARLRTFTSVAHRLRPIPTSFGTVLDDTYNANPASATAALDVLAQLGSTDAGRLFVFGEMCDLGSDSDRYHDEVLDRALSLELDAILPVGDGATAACRRRPEAVFIESDRSCLAQTIQSHCSDSRAWIVLIKGSRALELEELVDELLAADRGPRAHGRSGRDSGSKPSASNTNRSE